MKFWFSLVVLALAGFGVQAEEPWLAAISKIRNVTFTPAKSVNVPVEAWILCDDEVSRPYVYVIPDSYNASEASPMLMYLHGLTQRRELVKDRTKFALENPFTKLAQEMGAIVVFPFSQFESNWFNDVGMNKVNDIVAAMKKQFNVDDDRVWLTGFSDGGSGSFGMSMLKADNFAAFMPLNGQMGVTAQVEGKHLYPVNMAMSPLYVVNTELDNLYPSAKMKKTISMANKLGAGILFNEHKEIGHDFSYADTEMPNFKRFLLDNLRISRPEEIVWKSATGQYGTRFWISINETVDEPPASWHVDHSMMLTDERIMFGFNPDWDYEGQGTFVHSVNPGDIFSNRIGLLAGDVITRINDNPVNSLGELLKYKDYLSRAKPVELTVLREGKELELIGDLDPIRRYDLFPRERISGMVKARYNNNVFDIETSRVKSFSLRINPDMVDHRSSVKVIWNGKVVHEALVEPDVSLIEANYRESGERKNIYSAKLSFAR